MGFQQSQRSDNKQRIVLFIPKSGHKYFHTNSYNFVMTVISLDDHLTAGAWTACAMTGI